MRTTLIAAALLLALSFAVTDARANGHPRTLVRAERAVVYELADASSRPVIELALGAVVAVRPECDADAWCSVTAYIAVEGRSVDGWMRGADLLRSSGISQFFEGQFAAAAVSLEREVAETTNPTLTSWLQLHLGYSRWALGEHAAAHAAFDATAARQPIDAFAPFARLASAKLYLVQGDEAGAHGAYGALRAAFPDFTVPANCLLRGVDFYPLRWPGSVPVCDGDPRIARRIEAIEATLRARDAVERVRGEAAPTPRRLAEALLALARAGDEREQIDPAHHKGEGSYGARQRLKPPYEAVVAAAPDLTPAGHAAWRITELSAPYEWEGNWQAQADWVLQRYSAFLNDYPRHELAPEAVFKVAAATWTRGGYPEVFGLVFDPGGWDVIQARLRVLAQWFETERFGGGRMARPVPQREAAIKAQQMFREVLRDAPSTPSAAMAQYYIAVIFDYCLEQPALALPEYEALVSRYPAPSPFLDRARRRIAVIRELMSRLRL